MNLDNHHNIKSILLIDDDDASLELYSHLIKERLDASIISVKYPTQAINYALKYFFDLILIDVTINYNGSPFGGFEIYKSLTARYGDSSMVAYSQYVTDDLLKEYEYNFNFIEKSTNQIKFIDKIVQVSVSLRKKQKCFVAMPFENNYDDEFNTIKTCLENSLYKCVRLDRESFNKSIIKRMFQEIEESKLIIFLANDKNPNVFYECGYAVALDKEIITITDSYDNLPFDIRDMNAIAYGIDLKKLESSLIHKLSNLTITDAISPV